MNMFWQHYLEKKKINFLACIREQVYTAILESSKNNGLFHNYQNYNRLKRDLKIEKVRAYQNSVIVVSCGQKLAIAE